MTSESVEQIIIKEKRRSKGRRRSSFADEALRLINMSDYQAEETSQRQLLEAIIDRQYDFIQEQLNILKTRLSTSEKMASKSNAILAKAEEEFSNKICFNWSTNVFDKPKGYDLLTKEHKEFLDSHDINEEYLKKFLKELKNRLILKEMSIMKENKKIMENRQFIFYNNSSKSKKISRSSRSRSSFALGSSFTNSLQNQMEKKDLIDIGLEYFNTTYGDE